MTIILFLYIFLAVVAVFVLYSLFNIYHLLRFGYATLTNVTIITLYVAISCVYLMTVFVILGTINWATPLFNFALSDLGL